MDDRDLLRQTPVWIEVMTANLSDAQWRQRPAEGQWSALEVVGHLYDIEADWYGDWIRRIARGERTDFTGLTFAADELVVDRAHNEADPRQRLAAFKVARTHTLTALGGDDVPWQRRWTAGTRAGDLRDLVRRLANHDAIHIGQLGKIRRAIDAIRGGGPTR
jgi:uncharacterized damage-inducible protein DinB